MKHTPAGRRPEVVVNLVNDEPRQRPSDRLSPNEKLPLMARVVVHFGASARKDRVATLARRSHPIRAYVGPNGGGKSLAMVHDVLPSLARGRRVLSTVPIYDAATGELHPLYTRFDDFGQLLEAEGCDILMDEVVGVANARSAMSLPAPVQNVLVQLRRRDCTLSVTAPAWARMDKIIREVCQLVTECRGYYPAPAPVDDAEVRLWSPRRVFRWRSYDTLDFDEWTSGKREKLEPLAAQWFKGVGSVAFDSYNTMDAVSMVSGGDPNVCDHCGKKKHAEYCKGHDSDSNARSGRRSAGSAAPLGVVFEPSAIADQSSSTAVPA